MPNSVFHKNNKKKSSIIKQLSIIVVTVAFVSTIGFISVNYYINKDNILKVAATTISKNEFNEILNSRKYVINKMHLESNIDDSDIRTQNQIEKKLKNSIIQDEVIYQVATKENITVSDAEISKEFDSYKLLAQNDDEYMKNITENNISDDTIKKYIEKDLISKKYIDKLMRKTKITENEIKDFYLKNKSDLFTVSEVEVSHILLKTIDANKQEYPENKKNEVKNKLEELLKRINSGEDFAALAMRYSEDEGSASLGGNLGYISKGVMDKSFEDVALNLEIGHVSPVIETPFGYHLIKASNKRVKELTLDECRALIEEMLRIEKVKNQLELLIKNYPVKIYR